MNKKVLSAILFSALFACTGTFTSCIDNDEPEGITNLRGAKAELLRAKVAVEQAEATFKLAQAELEKAKAAVQNSIAEQNKALADYQKMMNEYQSIQNESAKADLDAKIAAAELAAEQAKLDHEIAMTNLTKKLAEAKRGYEVVLAEIEIAKATLSGKERVTITDLEWEVIGAENAVAKAESAVETAEEDYYNATLDVKRGEVTLKRMETKIANAEATLATAQAEYEKWNGFLAEESETADWTAEITTLEDSIKGLEKKQVELELEKARLTNSEEYKKLIDDVRTTTDFYNNQTTTEKYSFTDAWDAEVVTDKYTPIEDAIVEIGGAEWDGKGGRIAAINNRIAYYTSERKAVLDLIAAGQETAVANAKKTSDEAVAAWTAAKTAYADAQTNAKDVSVAAAEAAVKAYKEALATIDDMQKKTDANGNVESDADFAARKLVAKLKANQSFADAMVAFYNTIPADQVGFNNLTLVIESTINGVEKKEYVTKTVKGWLSDANKDVYVEDVLEMFQDDFEAFYREGKQRKDLTDTEGNEYETAKSAFKKDSFIKTKAAVVADKLSKLVDASKTAFGTALLVGATEEKGYMQVVPTDEEVMAVPTFESTLGKVCGALGEYVWKKQPEREYEAKNYAAIIAKYQEAVTYWTEVLNTLTTARAEAKAAKEAAEYAKWLKDYEIHVAINVTYGDIDGQIAALTRVKKALAKAVTDYLKVDYADYNGNVAFEAWLKGQVEQALYRVYDAEDALIYAQNMMQQMKDGKIDVWAQLAEAEEALAEAMAELEEKQAELETALANLAKGLEIIASVNAGK